MSRAGTAVVTGGAGGLGAAIARRLAADGHELVLVDLDPAVAATAAAFADARAVVADVTESAGREAVVDAARHAGAPLRVLVNNAGITRDARVEQMTDEQFSAVLAVNLLAPMRLTYDLAGAMDEGGSVVNMSSRSGLGNFGQLNYAASKAGLMGFTRAMALRLAPRVRVNAIAPGLISTPMTDGMPDAVLRKLVARIPAGRIGVPEDVAELVAFLSAPAAGYITGQVIVTCGGRSIAP